MRLRYSPASPFMRKVMVVAHEHGLVERIETVPTALSPVEANENLAGPRTIGQIAIGCALGYLDFRFPGDGWRGRHPQFAGWYREAVRWPSMPVTRPPAA